MTWRVWWMFFVTETALSISPGPAVLFVISQSLGGGASRGVWAALGIVSANVVWFTLSAVGLGAVLLAMGDWFFAVKWLGAAYLVYLAIKPFWRRLASYEGLPPGNLPQASALGVWTRAVALQLTNPKALMFFGALLPQFVRTDGDVAWQILILGATSVLSEFPVLALYAMLAGGASEAARGKRFALAIDVVIAALLIAAALGIALAGDTPSSSSNSPQTTMQKNELPE
jgi:threonine/homoserine/homoserine lactone efflux protein